MKALIKFFGIILAFVLLVVWFFFDNIKGYYIFKEYCEKEGGLKVYEPLEKNVGWLAEDKTGAMSVAQLNNIHFSRFYSVENGEAYDVRYKGGISLNESSYEILPAQTTLSPIYQWKTKRSEIENQLRLHLYAIEVFSIEDNKLMARYHVFTYELFNRDKTILDMPIERTCHTGLPGSATTGFAQSIKKLNMAFKN